MIENVELGAGATGAPGVMACRRALGRCGLGIIGDWGIPCAPGESPPRVGFSDPCRGGFWAE